MLKKNKQLDERLDRYSDTEGLSTRQLNIGLWYVRNKKKFFVILIILLILTAVGTIGYSLYQFSSYLIVGIPQDQQTYLDLTSATSLVTNKVNVGNNISYSEVKMLPNQNNTMDLVAAVTNSSPSLSVRLKYYFVVDDKKIGEAEDFILPSDTKYLMSLNQAITSSSLVNLVIEQTSFIRLDRHKVSDWNTYRSDRFNFLIENAKFTSGTDSGLSEKISLGQLDFKITNNSAFSYKTVPLAILLKSQGQIMAVNRYIINNFRSGEAKVIQLSWPGRVSSINEVEILPDINILDDTIYLNYSAS
jgi:hypothetical protein